MLVHKKVQFIFHNPILCGRQDEHSAQYFIKIIVSRLNNATNKHTHTLTDLQILIENGTLFHLKIL